MIIVIGCISGATLGAIKLQPSPETIIIYLILWIAAFGLAVMIFGITSIFTGSLNLIEENKSNIWNICYSLCLAIIAFIIMYFATIKFK